MGTRPKPQTKGKSAPSRRMSHLEGCGTSQVADASKRRGMTREGVGKERNAWVSGGHAGANKQEKLPSRTVL